MLTEIREMPHRQTVAAMGCKSAATDGFDGRDFRKALGQFATGVVVVTARAHDGRAVGVTVNSFSSVSLDPPLVLWSLARTAPSLNSFAGASHFAIHILAAHQHELARQFATPHADKFRGVDCDTGAGGVPLLQGVLGRFVCCNDKQYDGGDHVIFVGKVAHYERFEGEPLVFHSGSYCIANPHPQLSG